MSHCHGTLPPTEGAACGAFGALVLTIAYGRMTGPRLVSALIKTLDISVLILFLIAAANFYGAVFSRLGTPAMLTNMLLDWDISRYLILAIVMAVIFLLGWPLEWPPIVLIIVPILIPLINELAFIEDPRANLLWFGIIVTVNLQTSWLSPPVALSAYFLKAVVPQWDLMDIYKGMMQFMVLQLLGLILVIAFPEIVLWLPRTLYGY
jgi:TRAP-type mannitol/chloroaromatic compound transport system permease large subunit